MAIVDPFKTPAASGGIVDPFKSETPAKTDEPSTLWGDYKSEVAKDFSQGWEHLTAARPEGAIAGPVSTLARVAAPLEMLLSPLSGLRSPAGHAIAGAEQAVGENVVNPIAERLGGTAQHPDYQPMYEAAKGDFDKAMLAAGPGRTGVPITGAPFGRIAEGVAADTAAAERVREIARAAKATPPAPASEVDQALQRSSDAGMPIDLPRAITSESPAIRAGGQALSVAPIVGTPLREAVQAVPAQVGGHLENIAAKFSPELPENIVGGGIERDLTGAAKSEAAARQADADAAHAAATQQWERQTQAREQEINSRLAGAGQETRRAFGDVDPNEMGEDAIASIQAAEGQARRAKEARYDAVNDLNARVSKDAFSDVGQTAESALKDAGFTVDPATHPNASSMMSELGRLTGKPAEMPPNVPPRLLTALQKEYGANIPPDVLEGLGFPGAQAAVEPDFRLMGRHAPTPGAPDVSIQGVEALRKRVGQMAFDAQGDGDRAASGILKNAFDDWYERATENHLTPDSDPNALGVIREARAANADWRNRFGYNHANFPAGGERRNAARILNRAVTGDIGPEELSRQIIGAKPGTRGVSAPLYDAMANAVADPAALRNNVRGAYWNRIAGEGRNADRVAGDIGELAPTRMGSRLFDPAEHDAMRAYGELAQRTPQDLRQAAVEARAAKPKPTKIEPGKSEQLAGRMLGRNRSDEQVLSTVDRMMRTGGDIKNFARTWGTMSEASRNELRGAWLRNMGGGGENFNVSAFVKNWGNYSDQAKAIMLDRSHRQQLQDFHTALERYADTIKKYGNPSGTAQVTAWHKLASGALKTGAAIATGGAALLHPIGVAVAGLGLRKVAKVLAAPQGAAQLNRWSRLAKAYHQAPSTRTLILLQGATRNLESTQ